MMIVAVVVFFAVVAVDQLSKSAIIARLHEGAATAGVLYGIRFRHVANRRQPWKSRAAMRWMAIALMAFAVIAAAMTMVVATPAMYFGAGALIGGATGNVLDGFRRNAVTDFIDLRFWPVFNIADAAIVGGAVLMLWELASI